MIYQRPMFYNEQGYDLRMLCGDNERFEFNLDAVNPLTYWGADGGDWQPDRHFFTDRGSQGYLVSMIPGFERNRLAYLFHDSAYNWVAGKGHGLYYRAPDQIEFTFRPMTRRQVDDLMREMLITEGIRPWAARCIWAAVRLFGKRW